MAHENENLHEEDDLVNYDKQVKYKESLNIEDNLKENIDDRKDERTKPENNIKHKKNSNGELDLDFLDIPAFLRKQAD